MFKRTNIFKNFNVHENLHKNKKIYFEKFYFYLSEKFYDIFLKTFRIQIAEENKIAYLSRLHF